jgi:hypothetical protein
LFHISSLSSMHRRYVIERHHMISLTGDLFLGEASPISQSINQLIHQPISQSEKRSRRAAMGNAVVQPDWTACLNLLSYLARSSLNEASIPNQSHSQNDQTNDQSVIQFPPGTSPYYTLPFHEHINLSRSDTIVIQCKQLYQRCLSQNVGVMSMSLLACHWCWQNVHVSEAIVDLVMNDFMQAEYDVNPASNHAYAYLTMIAYLMSMTDDLRHHRISLLWAGKHGLISMCYKQHTSFYAHAHDRRIHSIIQMIVRLHVNRCIAVDEVLVQTRSDWQWMDHWLRAYTTPRQSYAHALNQRDEERYQVWQSYLTMLDELGLTMDLAPSSSSSTNPAFHSSQTSFSPTHSFGRSRNRRSHPRTTFRCRSQTLDRASYSSGDVDSTPGSPLEPMFRDDSDPVDEDEIDLDTSMLGADDGTAFADDSEDDIHDRRDVATPHLPAAEEWACKSCTFLNSHHMTSCEMCDTLK